MKGLSCCSIPLSRARESSRATVKEVALQHDGGATFIVWWALNTARLAPFALRLAKGLMRDQTLRCAQGERIRTLNERYWVGTPCPPNLGKTVRLVQLRRGGQRLPTLQKSGSWIRRKTP